MRERFVITPERFTQVVLAAWTALGTLLTARTFRWE